jgi:hypothetical protein
LRGVVYPPFSKKRLEDIENKENREARDWRADVRGLKVVGGEFGTREAGNLETTLAGKNAGGRG